MKPFQSTTEQHFKKLWRGYEKIGKGKVENRVYFEGGWWIKGSDYDLMWLDENDNVRIFPRKDIGLTRNEETRQLTIYYLP